MIYQHDLERFAVPSAGSTVDAAAQQFNRLPRLTVICVANDIGQGFIDRAGHGPALRGRKAQLLREAHHRASHYAQDFGIAGQLKPEKPARGIQPEASLPGVERNQRK